MKRQFYAKHVDAEFDKTMKGQKDEEVKIFNKHCQQFNSLGDLAYVSRDSDPVMVKARRFMHTFDLLQLPMGLPLAWLLPLLASLSVMVYKPKGAKGT